MEMESLMDNEQAYRRYKIRPRILVDVDKLDMSTEIFGVKVPFPLGFSPSAMHKLAHPEGEVATSRAAASQGICMGLSSYSTISLEDVAAQGEGNPYFVQICVLKDRRTTLQLLKRAEKAGYKAVFVSVDVPVLGRRLNEMRNNFILPEEMEFPNILSSGKAEFSGENEATAYDASLNWDTAIPWLKANTNMQIWLKGVNTAEDVALAIQHGLDGIVISNHGGRQLDGVPATLDTLRECAPIAKGRISIAVDGGIRQGSDIFKALALGAEHCFVGRIPIWGLAYKGQEGVELAIKILMQELAITMRLAGDIVNIEERCNSSSETLTLGPFGAFSLDVRLGSRAASNEAGRGIQGPEVMHALEAPEAHDLDFFLHKTSTQMEHAAGPDTLLSHDLPDLMNDQSCTLPFTLMSTPNPDPAWTNLDWRQSPMTLYDEPVPMIVEEIQATLESSVSDATDIQDNSAPMESMCPTSFMFRTLNDPLPHIDILTDLFRNSYARPGSTWQVLQMPEIQKTLGKIALKMTPSHASYAVLRAVLAAMSFHMDRLNTTEPRSGYWWTLGEDYMSQAVAQVKLLLAKIPIAVDNTRYKSTVMALLTMVALTSGKLEETRIYLLDTQKFIKQHASPEKQKSRKIQLLHALFVYLRVLEESTYIYPISFDRSLSNNRSHIYSVTKFPSLAIKDLSDPLHTPQRPSFEKLIVPDFCFEAPNNAMRRMFAHMLCLPESLLVLMSHITFVACEARQARGTSQTIDASIKQDFDDRAKVIEDLLCAWTFQNDRLNWVTADSIEESPRSDGRDDVLEHIATAFHSALLLYFYREVKQVNRLVLQPLVKKITTHLIDCENSKQQNNVPSNSVIWPGFMAAIEALEEEDFAQVIGWMRSCADRYSLRAFDRAITAATELRTLRVHTGTDSWPDTMLQKGIFLVLS
ncbi:FMN-dependent dehydrogenase, partial [Aureobasidium melanogenum]